MPEEGNLDNPANITNITDKNISSDKNKTNKPRNIIFFGVLLLVLIILLGAFSYTTFLAGKNKKQPSPQISTKPSSTEGAKTKPSSYCPSGQVYKNKKQGYQVCLIKGWYTRQFNLSAASVGFDPNPIPEASEYGGLIVVSVSNKTSAEVLTNATGGLENKKSSSVTVDGATVTQIMGNIPADNVYYPNFKEAVSIFTKPPRTYEVTMLSPSEKLAANKKIYDDFLAGWEFLPDTPNPPWSDSGNILVEAPWPGDEIGNPVTISGQALVFEGTVSIRIKDVNGTVLASTFAQAASGVELSEFSKSVSYTNPTTSSGTVEVFSISAKDGSEQDKVVIPVKFK